VITISSLAGVVGLEFVGLATYAGWPKAVSAMRCQSKVIANPKK
jgi:hypothetical protein